MKLNYRIAIIGLGYVGLPLARLFATKYTVMGYDINKQRVDEINSGLDTTLELSTESLNEVLIKTPSKKNGLFCSNHLSDLQNCNFYIITVPTPVDSNNKPVLTPLIKASEAIGSILNKNDIVVYESTVYPGATEEVCVPILEKKSKSIFNKDFYVGYSPERINPGDKLHTVEKILKVTSGSNPATGTKVNELYKSVITAGTHLAPSIKVAEAAKVIENSQRDINIAFVNELSILFNKLGLETSEVLEAAGTKWNFNKYYPGLVGGHCIGVDPYYLAFKAKKLGLKSKIILAGRKLNNEMASYIFDKIINQIDKNKKKYSDSNILILGATFKENCGDFRNSKVFDIMKKLDKQKINYSVVDPYYSNNININSSFKKNFCKFQNLDKKFDIILISVGHQYFKKLGVKKLKSKLSTKGKIFDLKSIFKKNNTSFRL